MFIIKLSATNISDYGRNFNQKFDFRGHKLVYFQKKIGTTLEKKSTIFRYEFFRTLFGRKKTSTVSKTFLTEIVSIVRSHKAI